MRMSTLKLRSGASRKSVNGLQEYIISGHALGALPTGAGASAPWGVDAGWITRCWRPRQPRRGSLVRLGRPLRVALSRSRQKVFARLRSAQRLQAASLPDPDTHGLAAPRVLPIEAVSQRGAVGQKLPASPPQLRGWTRFRPELDVLGSCDRGSPVTSHATWLLRISMKLAISR